MKFSMIDKKSIIDAFEIAALVIEPDIMYKILITGAKEFIAPQSAPIKSIERERIVEIIEKTEIEIHNVEHIEKAVFRPSDIKDSFITLKIDDIKIKTSRLEKDFIVDGRKESK